MRRIEWGFENDVEMYGAQTKTMTMRAGRMFENDVEMYGAQTSSICLEVLSRFENDVEMYGAQTCSLNWSSIFGLRMM